MKTFLNLLYKDFLLLIRDKAGLLLLFAMPLALVLIMTSMQDGIINVVTNTEVSLLLINDDKDSIGNAIEKELSQSTVFNTVNGRELNPFMTEDDLRHNISKGKYLVGIYIPDSITQTYILHFTHKIEKAMMGCNNTNNADSFLINVYLDPAIKPSVHSALMSNIREFMMKVQNQFTLKMCSDIIMKISGHTIQNLDLSQTQSLKVNEKIAEKANEETYRPNAVQHNVPAWTLFAIFFIVVSFSGNTIKEREDGSFDRLMTMPCSFAKYLSSKMLLYVFVCILQFLMVLAMGVCLFPLLGLDVFEINGHFFRMFLVVFCAACAAIGFGTAISTIASSQQQAAIFGSVSVVIMAAIGGIWIPTFAMPDIFKFLSNISPLNWGMEASYGIIMRDYSLLEVLPQCVYLLLFALFCFGTAVIYKKIKIN
ncbi:MAG TPA: ABC transporter permease [Bacteroidales bacterium]|jgi:ABC-2 type transport system permease protein|nr:ABC transporter permease [Bacteroidales bacterium]